MAMASGGGGESVVAFFRRLGVPNAEALKPDDLDWMLENVTNVNSDGTSQDLAVLTVRKLKVNAKTPLILRSKFGVSDKIFLPAALAAWSWDGLESCSSSCSSWDI